MTEQLKRIKKEWTRTERRLLAEAERAGAKRSISQMCKAAGCSRSTYYRRMESPRFAAAWERAWRKGIATQMPGLVGAQVHKGMGGDTQAFRALAEVGGYLNRGANVQLNQQFNQQIDFESPAGKIEIARRMMFEVELNRRFGTSVDPDVQEMVEAAEASAAASSAPRQLEYKPQQAERKTWPHNLPNPEKLPGRVIDVEPAPEREPLDRRLVPIGSDYGEHGLPRHVDPRVIRKGDKR